jgi:hypothetical protein
MVAGTAAKGFAKGATKLGVKASGKTLNSLADLSGWGIKVGDKSLSKLDEWLSKAGVKLADVAKKSPRVDKAIKQKDISELLKALNRFNTSKVRKAGYVGAGVLAVKPRGESEEY